MKRITKIITTALALLIVCIAAIAPVSATYEYKGSFVNKEGGFIGIGTTSYTYKVYRDNVEAYLMYHSKDLCYPFYHNENDGTIELSYSRSVTISSETAYNFSKSLGLEVGIAKLVGLAASASNGLQKTSGYSITATGTVGTTLPADSPTGYYKLTPCQNFHQRRLDKYKENSTLLISSEYQRETVKLDADTLRRFFPDYTPKQMETAILRMLEEAERERQRQKILRRSRDDAR